MWWVFKLKINMVCGVDVRFSDVGVFENGVKYFNLINLKDIISKIKYLNQIIKKLWTIK